MYMSYFLKFRQGMDTLRGKLESIRNSTRTALKEFMDGDGPAAGADAAASKTMDASGSGVAGGSGAGKKTDASGVGLLADASGSGAVASKPAPTRNEIIIGQIVSNVLTILYYLFVILIASLISHEFIFQPRISRIIAFSGVFLLCALSPFFLIIFGLYFIAIFMKGAVMKYVVKDSKYVSVGVMSFLPTLYTMLPITTYPGVTTLGRILRTPFFYPQSVESKDIIEKKQAEYVDGLKASFNGWDATVKSNSQLGGYLKGFIDELTAMNAYQAPLASGTASTPEPLASASKPADQPTKPAGQAAEPAGSLANQSQPAELKPSNQNKL